MILAFALAGGLLIYLERKAILLAIASYGWKRTEATVVDSSDASFTMPGVNRLTSISEVTCSETRHVYQYEVDGRIYQTSTYCFGAQAEQAGAAFLIGTKVPIYYDPNDPKTAVVNRGIQLSMFFGPALLLTAFLLILFARATGG